MLQGSMKIQTPLLPQGSDIPTFDLTFLSAEVPPENTTRPRALSRAVNARVLGLLVHSSEQIVRHT